MHSRLLKVSIYMQLVFMGCQPAPKEEVPIQQSYDFKFEEFTIHQMQEGFANGDFTIKEVTQTYLDRIETVDKNGPELNSVIQVNPDALKIAEQLDQELQDGQSRGLLHGIPVMLKDNIDTHDQMETTAGSRALIGSHPLQDSWVAKKLREAGAVILGKTNLSEWSLFPPERYCCGWSAHGGQTKNPYKLNRTPCGSSSGSGVAVSANLCMVAIGVETNGSIVCPAASNGIVGIKPTVGLLSRSGIIPITFTQDTPGPMARSVKDVAICLGGMVGIDSSDSKTLESQGKIFKDYTRFLKEDGLNGKRIGLFKKPFGRHRKMDNLMRQSVDYLVSQGVEIVEIEEIIIAIADLRPRKIMLYEFKDGLNKYFASLGNQAQIKSLKELIAFNDADSIELKHFDRQELLKQAQKMESLDTPEYKKALKKMLITTREQGIDRVMNEHNLHAIIAPTGGPAPKIYKIRGLNFLMDKITGDNFLMVSSSPAAFSGYPSITVPIGSIDGLPVGVSFFGRAWSEPVLLEIAYAYEQGTKHRMVPTFLEE